MSPSPRAPCPASHTGHPVGTPGSPPDTLLAATGQPHFVGNAALAEKNLGQKKILEEGQVFSEKIAFSKRFRLKERKASQRRCEFLTVIPFKCF